MKLGDEVSDKAIQYISEGRGLHGDRFILDHIRCGRVVFARREDPTVVGLQKAFHWVVIECERPDEESK